jgi:hypothetical protein
MNANGYNSNGAKRTRSQIADEIVTAAIVFTRRARREGHANTITDMTLLDMATERGYDGGQYSLRTLRTLTRARCRSMAETHLLDAALQ